MFKSEWEKTQTRVTLHDDIIACMLRQAMPYRQDYTINIMPGGCANLNYKIEFKNNDPACILRVYIRDPKSGYREQKISELLKKENKNVPMANYVYIGDCQGYSFALVEFMQGVTLRNVLLHYGVEDWKEPMYAAGKILADIGKIGFSQAGFFNEDLKVVKPFDGTEIAGILKEPSTLDRIGQIRMEKIHEIFLTQADVLPDASHHHLVHGDYDPSNILVEKHEGVWRITAVLDWEFAFSGSRLWDVSNMLRYAHKMSAVYQESFLRGLSDAGVILPEQWEKITHMMSLVSLIEAVARGNPAESPNQYKDMYCLIDYQIENLQNVS